MFLCVHSVTNFSRNKTNIIKQKNLRKLRISEQSERMNHPFSIAELCAAVCVTGRGTRGWAWGKPMSDGSVDSARACTTHTCNRLDNRRDTQVIPGVIIPSTIIEGHGSSTLGFSIAFS